MAGNKNSGRKPKPKQQTTAVANATKTKTAQSPARRGRPPSAAKQPHSPSKKSTQAKMDRFVKKVSATPIGKSAARQGSPCLTDIGISCFKDFTVIDSLLLFYPI